MLRTAAHRLVLLVALAITAASAGLVSQPAIAADCDESLFECEFLTLDQVQRFLRDPSGNLSYPIPMKARQVTAVADLKDHDPATLALYDSLIPEPFAAPERPQDRKVYFWFVEVWVPNDAEGANLRWIESSISIRVQHGVEGGWLHLSEPTNDSGAFDTGRSVGFPKYYAAATLDQTDDGGWLARASIDPGGEVGDNTHEGEETVRYHWRPDDSAGASDELIDWTKIEDPYFSVEPFMAGEQAYRLKWTIKPYVPVGDLGRDSTLASVPGAGELGEAIPIIPPYTGLSEFTVGTVDLAVAPDLDGVHERSSAAYDSPGLTRIFPAGATLADLVADADPSTSAIDQSVPGVFWESEHLLLGTTTKLDGQPDGAHCAEPEHEGGDWSSYGQDLHNTRSQPAETTIGPANVVTSQLAWKFRTDSADVPLPPSSELQFNGATQGTPIVAGGCVYFGTERGNVYALNADTGQLVWARNLRARVSTLGHFVGHDGRARVFANVAEFQTVDGKRLPNPHVAAMDAQSGQLLWESRRLEDLPGAEVTGSPVPYSIGTNDYVITGISGWPGDDAGADEWYRPGNTRGSVAILDQVSGRVLSQTYIIPDEDFCVEQAAGPAQNDPQHNPAYHHDGKYDQEPRDVPPGICRNPTGEGFFARGGKSGGGVWTTPAVDLEKKVSYVGTGNPSFEADNMDPSLNTNHENTNAMLKFDLDPSSGAFGQILEGYSGDQDGPFASGNDWDFGASPTLVTLPDGSEVVGAIQKSGTFHAVDTEDMSLRWKLRLGALGTFAGNAATAATDGRSFFVPSGPAPTSHWSLDGRSGALNWVQPTFPQGLYGPATYANGVVYSSDIGFLRAAESTTGVPIMNRPMYLDVLGWAWNSDAGTAVARNTLYSTSGAYLAAYRILETPLPYDPLPAPEGEDPPPGPSDGGGGDGSGPAVEQSGSAGGRLPQTGADLPAALALGLVLVAGGAWRLAQRASTDGGQR